MPRSHTDAPCLIRISSIACFLTSTQQKGARKLDSRSRFLDRLKVCCFWSKNVSLTSGSPPTVLLCALSRAIRYIPGRSTNSWRARRGRGGDSRVWPGNALIVREVGRVILPFATQVDAGDLGGDVCWALVGAHEVRGPVRA